MRSSSEINRLLSQKQNELSDKEVEIKRRKASFSGETAVFTKKVSDLTADLNALESRKKPIIFPILICTLLAAVLLIQFGIWKTGGSVKMLFLLALGTVIVARILFGIIHNKPCRLLKKQIKDAKRQITAIESKDSKIALLEKELPAIRAEIKKLKDELESAELTELLPNCVLIHVKNTGGVDPRNIKIDGCDYGKAAEPFRIIPLDAGIHSTSLFFYGLENLMETNELQFSLHNNTKFISYKITYDINTKWVLETRQPETLDEFLKLVKMSKEQFKTYLSSL